MEEVEEAMATEPLESLEGQLRMQLSKYVSIHVT